MLPKVTLKERLGIIHTNKNFRTRTAPAYFGKRSVRKISWYYEQREHGLGSTYLQHTFDISSKATKTLGFLLRNLALAPRSTKQVAYKTLVRLILEYAAPVWSPYLSLVMFCACLFIDALWSPAGKGLTSWLSFVTFPLVSWVRCGT